MAIESTGSAVRDDCAFIEELPKRADAPCEPRLHVETIARRKILGFVGTIDESGAYYDNVHKQNQSLSGHIIADYHGRFLVELIQNAHDAHDRSRRDGAIAVHLACDEGDAGTLYVANGGRPFEAKNVDALCEIALSSKPPGESVGNKGLGFRSVRHVSDEPQIYSRARDEGVGALDGYRFTFAHDDQLDYLLTDPRQRALARADLPVFYVPRWLDDEPPQVARFAAAGYSSVVRLPLRNASALAVVRDEISRLLHPDAPMLLFLDRLKQLHVEVSGERVPGDVVAHTLTRTERRHDERSETPTMVDLGSNGRYWLVRATIAEPEMQTAVDRGLASHQLPESWRGWRGPGEVALAIPVGETIVPEPRLYTFLPMGRGAASPFNGHLHGTFFPSSNRTSIDPAIAVNALVLSRALALAAEAAKWIIAQAADGTGIGLPPAQAARIAVDLLVWTSSASLAQDAAGGAKAVGAKAFDLGAAMVERIGTSWGVATLQDAPFVPCLDDWTGDRLRCPAYGPVRWVTPSVVRRPSSSPETFSLEAIARHGRAAGIAPLWPGLGEVRTAALVGFLRRHAQPQQPFVERLTLRERADIATSLAQSLPRGPLALSAWERLYRDLPLFMDRQPSALAGCGILLCQDGIVRNARRAVEARPEGASEKRRRRRRRFGAEPSVFFPPRRGEAETGIGEDLFPPRPLREAFAFLDDRLPWYGALAEARKFLEGDLAQPFESEALLSGISQTLEGDDRRTLRVAGLKWAFAIWRRSVAIQRPLALGASYRLFVPTQDGGFLRASEAIFSSAWPERTSGQKVQHFLELAPADSGDIDRVRARRLAPPSHPAFGTKLVEAWTDFLSGLGVQHGLLPIELKAPGPQTARRMSSFAFLADMGLPEGTAELLQADVEAHVQGGTTLPLATNYILGDPLWWLPGQGDIARFDDDALEAYALLITDWIGTEDAAHFQVNVHHQHNHRTDTRTWPTPLAAFLRSAIWVSCEEPGAEGMRPVRKRGSEVWLPGTGTERYPPFLLRPTLKLGRAFDRLPEPAAEALRRRTGMNTFNAGSTWIEQIAFLMQQYRDGHVRRAYEREFLNIYNRSWVRLADRHAVDPKVHPHAPTHLIVNRRNQLAVAEFGAGAEPIFVRDDADQIAPGLITAIGGGLLDVRAPEPGRVGVLLASLYGAGIRRTSELDYALLVGGKPLEEARGGRTLVDVCPWLRPMLAVSLEALTGAELTRLPVDRSTVVSALDGVALLIDADVSFLLEGRQVPPTRPQPAYAFYKQDGTPVVVVVGVGALDWDLLGTCLPAIGETLQNAAVVPHMRLLARHLSDTGFRVGDRPDIGSDLEGLCRTLNLDDHASAAARETLGERLYDKLPWLRALVHLVGGDEALQRWLEAEAPATEDRVTMLGHLRACLPERFGPADDVLETVRRSLTVGELRDRLELDFAEFNGSLVATGSPPDVDAEGHARQLAHFIAEHQVAILEALRNAAADKVVGFVPEPKYRAMREALETLKPDPVWLPLFKRVPDQRLRDRVAEWLAGLGAPPLDANPRGLAILADVRAANGIALRRVCTVGLPLVRAWCIQNGATLPGPWRDAVGGDAALRKLLDDAGAFDLRVWQEVDLLTWFATLGAWPLGMQPTLDRTRLGIAATELEALAEKVRGEQEARDREARSVRVNGHSRDPKDIDWSSLAAEIGESLPRTLRNRPIGALSELLPVRAATETRRPGEKRTRGGSAYVGVPQEKKDMVGRLGELIVYHWLKGRQPQQDIDSCWVSGNGFPFTGRGGNDSLGYDFRISYNRQTWFIEVKASTDDPCQFEMGETEVRKARDVARSRGAERYVIAYVANVGQSGSASIEILPNPLSPEADGTMEMVGDSIRYRFRKGR